MRTPSQLVITFGLMLVPAFCQTTISPAPNHDEAPRVSAGAEVASAEYGRPHSAEEEGGSRASGYASPIVPSSVAAEGLLVKPGSPDATPRMKEWKYSLLALAASHSADAATSWNKRETNPLLAPNSGAFGVQTLALKLAITAGSVGLQAMLLGRHPGLSKMFARINFIESGVIGATAIHNTFVPSR